MNPQPVFAVMFFVRFRFSAGGLDASYAGLLAPGSPPHPPSHDNSRSGTRIRLPHYSGGTAQDSHLLPSSPLPMTIHEKTEHKTVSNYTIIIVQFPPLVKPKPHKNYICFPKSLPMSQVYAHTMLSPSSRM